MTDLDLSVSPPKEARPGAGRLAQQLKTTALGWGLVAPTLIVLIVFTIYPIIASLDASFEDFRGDRSLAQYESMINDPVLHKVIVNNLIFAVGTVPVSIALALSMALWVNGKIRGRGFLRLAFFTPTILPMVAAASIWLFFFTPTYGPIDKVLTAIGIDPPHWLGDPGWALASVMIVAIWKESGFFMIFYLAGLQNLSPELEEASQLEGASRWYHFRRVMWPLLTPTTLFVSIIALANSFKQVEHLFIMTEGGPNNATNLLLYYIYQTAFRFYDRGYAAALTVVLLLALLAIAIFQFRVIEKRTHYR